MPSPIHVHVERTFGSEWLITSQIAELVGRSTVQIRRYRKTGQFVPKRVEKIGKIKVPLYHIDQVDDLREFVENQRPGPKPKEKESVNESS